ncbi:MAG: tautomerase family protein [Desulfurococcaceae archaeon]
MGFIPIVIVYMWSGLSLEAKQKIVDGITKVFEDLRIPKEAVETVIIETSKENWGVGGELASVKFKQIKPP